MHAITDVTGFGLLGHALEMARGSKLALDIHRGERAVADAGGGDWHSKASLPVRRIATGRVTAPRCDCPRVIRSGGGIC